MFCWQLTVGVDGAPPKVLALEVDVMVAGLNAEMMDPLFEAEVAATGGNVEGVDVGRAAIKG